MSVVTFGLGSAPATGGWGWWDVGELEAVDYFPPLVQILDDGPTDLNEPAGGGPLQMATDCSGQLQKISGGGVLQRPHFISRLQKPGREDT